MKQSMLYMSVSTLLIGVFLKRLQIIWTSYRDCNIIYQFLRRYVHPYQDSFNLQQRQTVVPYLSVTMSYVVTT